MFDWYEIVATALGFGALLWGGWKAWKHIPKEIAEAFGAVATAIEDDKITKEEVKNIFKEVMDVGACFKK